MINMKALPKKVWHGLLVTAITLGAICPLSMPALAQSKSNVAAATKAKVVNKAQTTKTATSAKTASKTKKATTSIAAHVPKQSQRLIGMIVPVSRSATPDEVPKQSQRLIGMIVPVSRSATPDEREVLKTAYAYLGTPYVYGGEGPAGFDCSGFVRYVFSLYGIDLPHNAAAQASCGVAVDKSQLQPGDIVLFGYYGSKSINHSGIYLGDNKFIHASSSGKGVIVSSLASGYYTDNYKGARRVLR
ncbi:C40 family peptidase [Desulfurispora thermophila]|uniref:C40 family peptidase n=1 Tax=Desulfurispora thermophila TaxID=265470 RepID=UPI000375A023|nr:C40 family peptidase [Desulfurispora thermophila]